MWGDYRMLRACSLAIVFGLLVFTSRAVEAAPIYFSGTGSTGSISVPPGSVNWTAANNQVNGDGSWGIPGLGLGSVGWPDSSQTIFSIIFDLPPGVSIDPTPAPTLGGFNESTRFQNGTDNVLWSRQIFGNTVVFTAPGGTSLDNGDSFFVNVAFDGPINLQTLSFRGAFGANVNEVPEPASIALWSMLTVAGVAAWRRRKNAIAA